MIASRSLSVTETMRVTTLERPSRATPSTERITVTHDDRTREMFGLLHRVTNATYHIAEVCATMYGTSSVIRDDAGDIESMIARVTMLAQDALNVSDETREHLVDDYFDSRGE